MDIIEDISNIAIWIVAILVIIAVVLWIAVCINESRRWEDTPIPCPACGSKRVRLNIMASAGYQYCECLSCGHKFKDSSGAKITVTHDRGFYELQTPMVDQEGEPLDMGEWV